MLTFFRRIRKGLLDMGAARKYMLYAVGEIALVVQIVDSHIAQAALVALSAL